MDTPSGFLPPLSSFSPEHDTIDFLTRDSWSAYDVATAMQAVDGIYSTFLLARHLAVISNERNQRLARESERYWRYLEESGPFFHEFFHEWRRVWRRLGPGALPFFSPLGPMGGAGDAEGIARTSAIDVDYYLANPHEYMSDTDELVVQRIQMASPGGFTLSGIGEPLRELRELIKDLWYRNRQERQRGDLEIIQQKLDIVTQGNLAAQPVQVLAVAVSEDVQELKRLLENGRLLLPGEEPRNSPEQKKRNTRQRRPRRGRPDGKSGG